MEAPEATERFLGVDLGTSSIKCVILRPDGSVAASSSEPLVLHHPQPLWAEQTTDEWWGAFEAAMKTLHAAAPEELQRVVSVGVNGQMHGAVLLDGSGHALRPCILWCDGRCSEECKELLQVPHYCERSGNLPMPGFTAPKLKWVAKHEPAVFAATRMVLLPKDYLVWRLTGEYGTDASDAAGTLWLNPLTRQWDELLVAASGLSVSQLPVVREGTDLVGVVQPSVASMLNLPSRVVVCAGAADNAASALALGVTSSGQGLVSLGTSGVVLVGNTKHASAPHRTVHAFCHCIPKVWYQMGVTLGACGSLQWWSEIQHSTVASLVEEVDSLPKKRTNAIFLPYLNGERTPHNTTKAAGMFFNLRSSTTRAEMTLAVMEGVAFSLADCLAALREAGLSIPAEFSIVGGGAASPTWCQIVSDVFGSVMWIRQGTDYNAAVGAARLARLAYVASRFGVENALAQLHGICPVPAATSHQVPTATTESAQYYAKKLNTYRMVYERTKELMVGDDDAKEV